jgi:hypothetical protein
VKTDQQFHSRTSLANGSNLTRHLRTRIKGINWSVKTESSVGINFRRSGTASNQVINRTENASAFGQKAKSKIAVVAESSRRRRLS